MENNSKLKQLNSRKESWLAVGKIRRRQIAIKMSDLCIKENYRLQFATEKASTPLKIELYAPSSPAKVKRESKLT